MFFYWWFESRRSFLLNRKDAYKQMIAEYKMDGDFKNAENMEQAVQNLQHEADQLALHYVQGKNAWHKFTWWRIWNFSQSVSNFDDSTKPWWQQILETIVYVGGTVFLIKRYWFGLFTVPTGSAEPNLLVGDRIVGVKYPYIFKMPKRGDLVIFDNPLFKYSQNPIIRTYQKYIGFPVGPLPAGPDAWVKRLIALPGDVVELKINEHGKSVIYVNNKLLEEPYRNPYPVIELSRNRGLIDKKNPIFKTPILGPLFESLFMKSKVEMKYTYDPSRPYDDQPFYNFTKEEIVLNRTSGLPIIYYAEKGNPKTDIIPKFKVPENYLFLVGDNRWNSADCRSWGLLPMKFVTGRASFIFFSVDGVENWWFMDLLKNPMTFLTKKMRWARIFRFVQPFKEIPKN